MACVEKFRYLTALWIIVVVSVFSGCQGLVGNQSNPALNASINHIVVMVQENRSLDSYFGQLPAYWAANGYPAQEFDGLPANASNPSFDGTTTVSAFHLATA